MTNQEEESVEELVDIYYKKYNSILSRRYIEAYVILGSSLCSSIEEYEEYLDKVFNKEYRLRRSTKLLIHVRK